MKNTFKFLMSLSLIALCSSCGGKTPDNSSDETSESIKNIIDTTFAYPIPENPTVYVHYYNYAENYLNWLAWMWPSEPTSGSGARFYFQSTETIKDKTWATIALDTSKPMSNVLNSWDNTSAKGTIAFSNNMTSIGIIIRDNGGTKEYDGDRFIDLSKKSSDGKTHLYVIEGSPEMFYDVADVDFNMISSAELTSLDTIKATSYAPLLDSAQYSVTCANKKLEIESTSLSNAKRTVTIKLKEKFDMNDLALTTKLEIKDYGSRNVEYTALYSSKEFEERYVTEEQLGAIYTPLSTQFKIWSPVASKITLKLFEKGNGGNEYKSVELQKKDNGVFYTTVNGVLDKVYYTYDVTIGNKVNKDVVDPYAVSTGVNGLRGEILNMDALNPSNWDEVKIPTINSQSEALIYELHTRDLTSDKSWNGSEEKRSKYLGLCEPGTYIEVEGKKYPTGFDYIKQLGITHVQLQPIYDFNSVDETKMNDESYKNKKYGGVYNWGYDPQNYNSLEGSYSSDPYEGSIRVKEFKEVAKAYNNAGIGIVMDVVFNHMANASTSSFEKIFPGYYFRGRNDSGAGADTACERAMFCKYMEDVTAHFVKEYKLAGYRFDLMGLHTTKAMKEVANSITNAVHENNPNTTPLIYGEGWTMYGGQNIGTMADQSGVTQFDNLGAFNDRLRSGARGSSSMGGDDTTKGWLAGECNITANYNITDGLLKSYSKQFTGSSINYIECHDNLTLFDKLSYSNPNATVEEIKAMDILGAGLVYTSYGVSFIQAGQEFMKTKEVDGGDFSEKILHCKVTNRAYNRDSYNASDSINSLKWDRMVKYYDVVEAYKNLIAMRKEQKIFTPKLVDDTTRSATSILDRKAISQVIKANTNLNGWNDVIVLYNNQNEDLTYELESGYKFGYKDNIYYPNGQEISGNEIIIPAKQMIVIFK